MRLAVVNDVAMICALLARAIEEHTEHSVCWTAADGAEAVERCGVDTPDMVLMDLLMPNMDGVEATRRIMERSPCAILVVTATVSGHADQVFQAMAAGALDAINTPVMRGRGAAEGLDILLRKIASVDRLLQRTPGAEPALPRARPKGCKAGLPLVALGSSTGGPGALASILAALPADLPAAVVVVQHVDPEFMASMASWLDRQTPLQVRLARSGDVPRQGEVLVAGSADHLAVAPDGRLRYTPTPSDYAYRPSVNVFFESAAAFWPRRVVGVLLTGMGRDGAAGLLALRRRGMITIAQSQDSCAVYGMPKAAVELDAASRVLHLNQIATAIGEAVLDDTAALSGQGERR